MTHALQPASIHRSVLLAEAIEQLQVAERGGAYLDCTLGGAGHSEAILKTNPSAVLFAIDRDASALARAAVKLSPYDGRFELAQGSFADLLHIFQPRRFTGILADLGTSMDQLKGGRGFSFVDDGPLDMRMDQAQELSANEIVNTFEERALVRILQEGGCGSESKPVARAIVRARPIVSARALAKLIADATPPWKRGEGSHPATVPFQAIRIAVNDELGQIQSLLEAIPNLIAPGGRCVVITFHSLEDKLVTKVMRRWEQGGERSSLSRVSPTEKTLGKLITKKGIEPSAQEVADNPASRSARMRTFEFHSEGMCQQY
jgi:16S rRNA (cytosine1402-N4)-methyltransferase